jgi:hypothetical protein
MSKLTCDFTPAQSAKETVSTDGLIAVLGVLSDDVPEVSIEGLVKLIKVINIQKSLQSALTEWDVRFLQSLLFSDDEG